MRSPSFALALLLTAGGARGFIAEHEVTSLPGFDGPLPSKHFSGYLPVGKTSGVPGFIHYWLILSENAPATRSSIGRTAARAAAASTPGC